MFGALQMGVTELEAKRFMAEFMAQYPAVRAAAVAQTAFMPTSPLPVPIETPATGREEGVAAE